MLPVWKIRDSVFLCNGMFRVGLCMPKLCSHFLLDKGQIKFWFSYFHVSGCFVGPQLWLFVWAQNEHRFAPPFFIRGPMVHFLFPFPSYFITGRTLLSKCFTSLSTKSSGHASWCHDSIVLYRVLVKKAETYFLFSYTVPTTSNWS